MKVPMMKILIPGWDLPPLPPPPHPRPLRSLPFAPGPAKRV